MAVERRQWWHWTAYLLENACRMRGMAKACGGSALVDAEPNGPCGRRPMEDCAPPRRGAPISDVLAGGKVELGAGAYAGRPARRHRLQPCVEPHAFDAVTMVVPEQGPFPAAKGMIGYTGQSGSSRAAFDRDWPIWIQISLRCFWATPACCGFCPRFWARRQRWPAHVALPRSRVCRTGQAAVAACCATGFGAGAVRWVVPTQNPRLRHRYRSGFRRAQTPGGSAEPRVRWAEKGH
jgi:hypothetical protein